MVNRIYEKHRKSAIELLELQGEDNKNETQHFVVDGKLVKPKEEKNKELLIN